QQTDGAAPVLAPMEEALPEEMGQSPDRGTRGTIPVQRAASELLERRAVGWQEMTGSDQPQGRKGRCGPAESSSPEERETPCGVRRPQVPQPAATCQCLPHH